MSEHTRSIMEDGSVGYYACLADNCTHVNYFIDKE